MAAVMSSRLLETGSESGKVMAMVSGNEAKGEPVKVKNNQDAAPMAESLNYRCCRWSGRTGPMIAPSKGLSLTLGAIFYPASHTASYTRDCLRTLHAVIALQ